MRYIVKCSTGKDSEASVWWAYHNLPFDEWEGWFNDLEWDAPDVYEHLRYIQSRVGKQFVQLRPNQFDGKLSDEVLQKIVEIFGQRSVFAEMVLAKGRFPSTKARFCTEELKVKPAIDYILDHVHEDCVIIQGVRREESLARRHLPEKDDYFKFYFEPFGHDKKGKPKYHTYRKADVIAHCEKYDVQVLRPILKLTHQEVFNIIFENHSPGNALYKKGFSRVGCYPCVNASLREVLQMALNDPERIDQLAGLEELADSTFFPPGYIPAKYCSITRMVRVYREDLIKVFGAGKKVTKQSQQLFSLDIKDPEQYLYDIYFNNDKIPVYIDEDGDEYIERRVKCCTIRDVVNYVLKNPDQASAFTQG